MQSKATTPDNYIAELPYDRRQVIADIRDTINNHLPEGFKECMTYGMIGWVVPLELYPPGYHCDPKLPLGFMSLASQKNYISLYSMCLYSGAKELEWFQTEWPKHSTKKLDMGKCCIRFKKPGDVPLDLIAKLAAKVTPQEWIATYEQTRKK